MKLSVFICLLFCLIGHTGAQNSVTFRGRVVESKNNILVPVAGVVVSVSGESYDVTGSDGSFKLIAPAGMEFITVTIKGSSSNVISPYEGKVSLPPLQQPIEIKLCSEQNKALLYKVQQLNNRIKNLKNTQQLSTRQTELLYHTMLDTIEHFQAVVSQYASNLKSSEDQNNQLKEKIIALEKANTLLEEKLFLALSEKYTAQHKVYTDISATLNAYCSRLKDLHHAIPGDALACYNGTPQACNRFYETISKYNQARNSLNEIKEQHLQAVAHDWSDLQVSIQLNKVYTYALDQIHEPLINSKMNETIINTIKLKSQKKIKTKAGQKIISQDGLALANELMPMIHQLDQLKSELFNLLSNSIQ